MNIVGFDVETNRITDQCQAPPLVCAQFSIAPTIERWDTAGDRLLALLQSNVVFVGHTIAFDFAVACAECPDLTPLVWQAYADERVIDVAVDEKLIAIAHGRRKSSAFDLASLYRRYTGDTLDKDDGVRLEYGRLRDANLPLEMWPHEFVEYAEFDGGAPVLVHEKQVERYGHLLEDRHRQSRAAWWLRLMSVWGFRTDRSRVSAFVAKTQARVDELRHDLSAAGLVRANGSRDTKKVMQRVVEVVERPRKTPTGRICLDAETCEESGDELLIAYAEVSSLTNAIGENQVAFLMSGRVHSHFEELQDTGRTGSSKPNVQNVRRLPGLRECFVASPGKLLIDADYSMIELRTWAQVCLWVLGHSRLAELLNGGIDVHLDLGARILGMSYEAAVAASKDKKIKEARQLAKPVGFGLPGGMGEQGLQRYMAAQYRIKVSLDRAAELRDIWRSNLPEADPYFDFIRREMIWKRNREGENVCDVRHFVSNRYRGRLYFTTACNTFFQGLAADIAKAAGFEIARRCYDRTRDSMLYGARICNFVHDEFILEADEEIAAECALEVADIMVEAAKPFIPDIPAIVEPALSRVWSKDCEPVFDANGRLIPWEVVQ